MSKTRKKKKEKNLPRLGSVVPEATRLEKKYSLMQSNRNTFWFDYNVNLYKLTFLIRGAANKKEMVILLVDSPLRPLAPPPSA